MQVFSALVGSTMVFPDISSGNKYRIKVKGKAPTIYTRDFFVIDGSGIFSKNGTIAGPDELTYLFPTHEPRQLGTMFTSLRRQLSDLVRFASEMEQSEREYRELGHRLDPELKQLENDLEKHLARRAEIERELGSLERKRKDGDTHKPAKRTRKR